MKSPYPYFGGKSKIAANAWRAFGQVDNYVEPFFGSGAVLLSRHYETGNRLTETVNDLDGFIVNFWRAIKSRPDIVAQYCDYPVNETDLFSRHAWLIGKRDTLTAQLDDPEYFDPKIAGWWAWGACAWIGSGWCSSNGPWQWDGERIIDSRQLANYDRANASPGIHKKRPHLVSNKGIKRQLPHLGNCGLGINRENHLHAYLSDLSERMRYVRVACGDWSRIMGPSVTTGHGITGVFLDPPYDSERVDVYACESNVSADVSKWCLENGDNPLFRIILCGYDDEHDMPKGWRVAEWKATGGYGSQGQGRGRANASRERVWLSPHCCGFEAQIDLFDDDANADA